jgi:hypothetical protein
MCHHPTRLVSAAGEGGNNTTQPEATALEGEGDGEEAAAMGRPFLEQVRCLTIGLKIRK